LAFQAQYKNAVSEAELAKVRAKVRCHMKDSQFSMNIQEFNLKDCIGGGWYMVSMICVKCMSVHHFTLYIMIMSQIIVLLNDSLLS